MGKVIPQTEGAGLEGCEGGAQTGQRKEKEGDCSRHTKKQKGRRKQVELKADEFPRKMSQKRNKGL